MVNQDKGHLYFWQTSESSVVRICAAVLFSGVLLFLFYQLIPLPLLSSAPENPPKTSLRAPDLTTVSATLIATERPLSEYLISDSLQSKRSILSSVNASLDLHLAELIRSYPRFRPAHEINYAEVPVTIPNRTRRQTLRPVTPSRSVVTTAIPPLAPQIDFQVVTSTQPPLTLPLPPFDTLGQGRSTLTYLVSVSEQGELRYALPSMPAYTSKKLEDWIRSIDFPRTTKPVSYRLQAKMVRK